MSSTVLQDGFAAIIDQWQIVFGILILFILSQALLSWVLRQIFGTQLTSNEYLALSLAGWILPASLMSIVWILLGSPSAGRFNFLVVVGLLLAVLFLRRLKTNAEPDSKLIQLFLLLFLLISVLLRLAFVSRAALPSYFDSAQHYQFIKNLLAYGSAAIFTLQAGYYHLGFHILAAFLVSTVNAEIARAMLILGQIILAVMPISLFFPVRYITRSNWAGIFAVLVSAWGWYMPAHAVDWGKYPALTSIGLIPFVLSLAYLFVEHKYDLSVGKRWALGGLFVLGSFITVIIHSRSLFIFGIAGLAWIIAVWWQRYIQRQPFILFFIVIAVLLVELFLIQKQDVLNLLLDPYLNKGLWITVLSLVLAVFALKANPVPTLANTLAISFLLGSVFIPVPEFLPGYSHLTVLDRPFVEMFLYLPLSLLGGLGLAGVENFLQQSRIKLYYWNGIVSIPVIGLVLINAFGTYDVYPSDCCVIAGNNDVTAIDWIDKQLPGNAQIGIATTELKVMASGVFEGLVGSDGGIWITPLTNRATSPLPYETDFEQQGTLNMLCQMGISHLYVGELGHTFNNAQLENHPAWYRSLSAISGVEVYQVVGCNGNQG